MPDHDYQLGPANTNNTITKFDDFWDSSGDANPYRFLSNFYICPEPIAIELPWTGKMRANTTEHLYAAAKADTKTGRDWILSSSGPGGAKIRGRNIGLRSEWEIEKWRVMRVCVEAKFAAGTELAELLIETFPKHLREGTEWGDSEWGVESDAAGHPGHNLLGMILMDHRSRLMDGLPPIGFIPAPGSYWYQMREGN